MYIIMTNNYCLRYYCSIDNDVKALLGSLLTEMKSLKRAHDSLDDELRETKRACDEKILSATRAHTEERAAAAVAAAAAAVVVEERTTIPETGPPVNSIAGDVEPSMIAGSVGGSMLQAPGHCAPHQDLALQYFIRNRDLQQEMFFYEEERRNRTKELFRMKQSHDLQAFLANNR